MREWTDVVVRLNPLSAVEELNRINDEKKYQAFHLMADIGGGFASRLADAWFYADSENRERIEKAFADLLQRYIEMGETYKPAQPDVE